VSIDVGAHKYLLAQAWPAYEPLTFLVSNGMSSMGYGLGAALAATFAFPERPVVAICGDGGFSMVLQDLETAVRVGCRAVFVVLSDGGLSLVEVMQRKRGYGVDGSRFGPIDLVRVAEAMGASGVYVESFAGLEREVNAALANRKGPTVLQVAVDPAEYHHQI
jgi:acetolactate synthase-1/2/3 large subunit